MASKAHLKYTDEDGNNFTLEYRPYINGQTACQGCAFKVAGSAACRSATSCTPTDGNGARLVKAGYAWVANFSN